MAPSTEIIIIGGFLGSGKTTYLNTLLQTHTETQSETKKIALIINEFGKVPIDGTLIEYEGYTIQEIAGGCVCCTLQEKLIEGLEHLLEDQKPQLIYIEATGLATPWDMKENIEKRLGTAGIHIGEVRVTVDPKQYQLLAGKIRAYDNQFKGSVQIYITKQDIYDKKLCEEVEKSLLERYGCKSLEQFSGNFLYQKSSYETQKLVSFSLSTDSNQGLTPEAVFSFYQEYAAVILRAKAVFVSNTTTVVLQFDGITIDKKEISNQHLPVSEQAAKIVVFCRESEIDRLKQALADISGVNPRSIS